MYHQPGQPDVPEKGYSPQPAHTSCEGKDCRLEYHLRDHIFWACLKIHNIQNVRWMGHINSRRPHYAAASKKPKRANLVQAPTVCYDQGQRDPFFPPHLNTSTNQSPGHTSARPLTSQPPHHYTNAHICSSGSDWRLKSGKKRKEIMREKKNHTNYTVHTYLTHKFSC